MRRAVHHGTVPRRATPSAPSPGAARDGFEPLSRTFADRAASTADSGPVEVLLTATGTLVRSGVMPDSVAERHRQLAAAIMQRIESRLPGRVKNLAVRIQSETIVLEGECATYYTKQLAQHAALGVLEDEHLENAIVVTVGR